MCRYGICRKTIGLCGLDRVEECCADIVIDPFVDDYFNLCYLELCGSFKSSIPPAAAISRKCGRGRFYGGIE